MLKVTTEPSNCYASPVRVTIGGGLSVEVPEGPEPVSRRWVKAAAIVEAQLEDMLAARGARLQYRWVDDALIELRVVHATMPMSVMLAHPSLSKHLDRAICTLFGEPSVFYVSGGAIRACPQRLAGKVAGWIGPLELSHGFCQQVSALPLP
ncbi:hypothetical protein CRES_0822 [Corynebacterium resistens DSM 45100]|uniref:Uncharacterized protein n=1 Tax=Corynebacterium resistens (strain DSM 45100 / JCM 12819 / GTC 2026 / SICGH 158) TaxID=662755 RepID=F8E0D7_CORRG|nr:hypothetical protein CRES_0822 [Corynebacterium resistens DSM 45100]